MGADHPGKTDQCFLHGRTAESEDSRSIRTHSGCLPLQSQLGDDCACLCAAGGIRVISGL